MMTEPLRDRQNMTQLIESSFITPIKAIIQAVFQI